MPLKYMTSKLLFCTEIAIHKIILHTWLHLFHFAFLWAGRDSSRKSFDYGMYSINAGYTSYACTSGSEVRQVLADDLTAGGSLHDW